MAPHADRMVENTQASRTSAALIHHCPPNCYGCTNNRDIQSERISPQHGRAESYGWRQQRKFSEIKTPSASPVTMAGIFTGRRVARQGGDGRIKNGERQHAKKRLPARQRRKRI